jgi:hypothetical protein
LVARAFGIRWEGQRFVTNIPTSLGGIGENLWGAVQSVWFGLGNFLRPVTTAYGQEVTIGMVGILLIALGYWVFIRRA